MAILALTRWPGLMPPNFSAAYALMFCAGVYLPGGRGWWVPMGAMALGDIGLSIYYSQVVGIPWHWYPLLNYVAYGFLILLGRRFRPDTRWFRLLRGGIAGAFLFYLVTNTLSWLLNPFHNPEYTPDWPGWWTALTQGTAGHPPTWEFLCNTLLSGGLFTGLFAGAMKLADHLESKAEKEASEAAVTGSDEPAPEPEPEETPA